MAVTRGARCAVVAGAAGDIGLATMRRFRERGLVAVGWDRRVPSRYPTDGSRIERCDLLRDDDMRVRTDELRVAENELAHLVVVAGGTIVDELACHDVAAESLTTFRSVVSMNLDTAFNAIRFTVPLLRAATGPRSITLISSINSLGGYSSPGYSAAKAGLSGLAKALAPELGRHGIRINVLVLGSVDTTNARSIADRAGQPLDAESAGRTAALGRILTPDDVASAIVGVALDMAGATGADFILDGGQTIMRAALG